MPILRKQKVREYTTVDNYFVNDRSCPVDCKGFLLFMLSKPDDWNFNFKNFQKELNMGSKAIRTIINKLESLKYLKRERIRDEKGYYSWIYFVYEKPYDLSLENDNHPYTPKGYVDDGDIQEGNILLNTNINKDKDDKQITSSFFVPEEHNRLTLELIEKNYINKEDLQLYYYDDLFETLLKQGNSYRDLITMVNYIVTRVVDRKFIDEEGYEIKNKFGYLKNAIYSNINKLIQLSCDRGLFDEDEYDWLNDDEEDYEL